MFLLACRMVNQMFLGYAFPGNVALTKAAKAPFRLWPTDLDVFFHMNNASYIRVAELSRWRILTESGLLSYMINKRILFLVVEQTITYSRPIMPFQKYVVSTNVKVSDDDKWMYYTHSFNAPADPKSDLPPVHHALITLKAVLKESGGRTVKPSDAFSTCDYHKHITTK